MENANSMKKLHQYTFTDGMTDATNIVTDRIELP